MLDNLRLFPAKTVIAVDFLQNLERGLGHATFIKAARMRCNSYTSLV
jgi:hypothetical protein